MRWYEPVKGSLVDTGDQLKNRADASCRYAYVLRLV
jgi:hypothetical protein